MTTLHDFTATAIDGADHSLDRYRGRVVLVVNTASRCGLTPQFAGLERLHRDLAAEGLAVIGFPCNQFAGQEPLDEAGIDEFCRSGYDVSFPMYARIDVNGAAAHPLYRWLKAETRGITGSAIKWNFTKFLVGRDGRVIRRYSPTTAPEALERDIRAALAAEVRA